MTVVVRGVIAASIIPLAKSEICFIPKMVAQCLFKLLVKRLAVGQDLVAPDKA